MDDLTLAWQHLTLGHGRCGLHLLGLLVFGPLTLMLAIGAFLALEPMP